MHFTVEISDDLVGRFELALQLTGDSREAAIEALMKSYVVQSFSKTASAYQEEPKDRNYAKAVHKIPKWAKKPMVIPSKIIRAYLILKEEQPQVSYSDLLLRCSDKERYPDEYVATFANNFAQMKFDDEKSHGKVFDVNQNQIVTLWSEVRGVVEMNEQKFKTYSTMVGYINKNGQKNMGRTGQKGTDHGQWLYRMQCEHCLHEYYANGTDIHLKKCPKCQGGADTGCE